MGSVERIVRSEITYTVDICSTVESFVIFYYLVGIAPLPYTTAKGEKIIVSKMINPDPNEFHFADVIKLYFMCFDFWMMQEGTASGHILACDMNGCVLGHILRLSPFLMKKFLFYLQEACPVRIRGFHFINTVPFMDKLLAIMKPFMKKELMNVMHLHQSVETFHEYVPKEYLPEDYGGPKESLKTHYERFYEDLKNNQDFFTKEEQTRRVDEKQRPGKPKVASDLFGVEGNFKKLDID
ncbi:alpha-tocopherol transfer protein-like isoform X2 [Hermetia illucens]|uniref:alpha-tocopherol transfer protein-like isoform X2 n=1 Tax=Hermetia illucens TaxID=343691 RepID=UPI0018CC0836|nr:alpha-tocopherol transfer protein-like isoform X2 [Hermetia illucens]